MMESVKIVLTCIAAAVLYGIAHDQVTAHVCVEYFSIAHPTILPLTSATLLAIQWGIVATWWVGLPLGGGLAISARFGARPPFCARDLRRPIGILLLFMGAASLLSGLTGFALAKAHWITLS